MRTVYVISSEEGIAALYNGLVAGLQRQVCFSSIRIGFYDTVKQYYISALYGDGKYTNLRNLFREKYRRRYSDFLNYATICKRWLTSRIKLNANERILSVYGSAETPDSSLGLA
jgi:Mitochondrial carrier protein